MVKTGCGYSIDWTLQQLEVKESLARRTSKKMECSGSPEKKKCSGKKERSATDTPWAVTCKVIFWKCSPNEFGDTVWLDTCFKSEAACLKSQHLQEKILIFLPVSQWSRKGSSITLVAKRLERLFSAPCTWLSSCSHVGPAVSPAPASALLSGLPPTPPPLFPSFHLPSCSSWAKIWLLCFRDCLPVTSFFELLFICSVSESLSQEIWGPGRWRRGSLQESEEGEKSRIKDSVCSVGTRREKNQIRVGLEFLCLSNMYEFQKEYSLSMSSNSKNKVKKVNQFLDSQFLKNKFTKDTRHF